MQRKREMGERGGGQGKGLETRKMREMEKGRMWWVGSKMEKWRDGVGGRAEEGERETGKRREMGKGRV